MISVRSSLSYPLSNCRFQRLSFDSVLVSLRLFAVWLSLLRIIKLDWIKSSSRVSSSLSSSEESDDDEEEEDWTMICCLSSLLSLCFSFILLLFFLDLDGGARSPVVHACEKFFCRRWTNCSPRVPKSSAGPFRWLLRLLRLLRAR